MEGGRKDCLFPSPSTLHPPPELWFVNTRFSCLCTRSNTHSFVPRWRPPFISALAPEDRCHLNGLCLAEGRPAFVTALGTTDTPGGWRADKKSGGVLMEVATGEVITRGLSMPHSPRWYDGRLWVLESGSGGFGCIDPATGKYQALTVLPGFTRGLDFCGPLAFIGLSQVRESAVFSGIAIAERPLEERCCGVWVVNIHTGQTIAFVKFEDAVQEIFAVQVLPGVRHPDVINDQQRLIADSFVVPDEALDLVPGSLRHAARVTQRTFHSRGDTAMTFTAMAAQSVWSQGAGCAYFPPRQVPAAVATPVRAETGTAGGSAGAGHPHGHQYQRQRYGIAARCDQCKHQPHQRRPRPDRHRQRHHPVLRRDRRRDNQLVHFRQSIRR